MEEWRDVAGFEGIYKVSRHGPVVRISTRRILKPYLSNKGYLKVGLYTKEGRQRQVSLHRIVAMAFVPGHEPGLHVNHIDGVKTNNSPSNLEWVTSEQNIEHATRIGLTEEPSAIMAEPVNGSVGYWFASIRQAVMCGFNSGNIYRCLSGGTKHHGGYRWIRSTHKEIVA